MVFRSFLLKILNRILSQEHIYCC